MHVKYRAVENFVMPQYPAHVVKLVQVEVVALA